MLRRISRGQVRLGMFIHAFDGPWLDHPFWLPRFHITEAGDLARIAESNVPSLVIDEERGLPLECTAGPQCNQVLNDSEAPRVLPRSLLSIQRARSFAEERAPALALVKHSTREMKRLFAAAHAGQGLQLDAFAPLVAEVMGSLSRNPYALIALTRLKRRDEYTYVHSLAVSALMTRFGRSLDMSEAEVFDLGLAGLLHDIGKMIVPDKILKKPDSLTDAEFALVRTHPEQGYLLLSQNPATPGIILDVCRHHHERLDGSGYPLGLAGSSISRVARIAAICDVYDALTSNRAYKAAWSSEEAISRMYDWSGHFDRELLVGFMKAIGVYPPGLLVRLRSNRLAVTLPNGRRASRPTARAFFSMRDRELIPFDDVVIDENLSHDQILDEQYPLDWGIPNWPLVSEQIMAGTVPKLLIAPDAQPRQMTIN